MPEIDKLFTAVEKYDGMNIDYLTVGALQVLLAQR